MKPIKALACLLFASIFSQVANSASMTSWTKINLVEVHDWAGIIIHIDGENATTAENCTIKDKAVLETTHYLFNSAYSTLLSSLHAKGQIRFFVDGCKQFGGNTIPVLKRIDIK